MFEVTCKIKENGASVALSKKEDLVIRHGSGKIYAAHMGVDITCHNIYISR